MTNHEKIGVLFNQIGENLDELHRLQSSWLRRFTTLRKQKRLLIETDAMLAEMGELTGQPHSPMYGPLSRNPVFPGHPLLWYAAQWGLGVYNAYAGVSALMAGRYWLAAFNLSGVLVCTLWRLPPWRLARQGKYNEND